MFAPIYQQINVVTDSIEELQKLSPSDLNHRKPVAINLRTLNVSEQQELIGLIENFFTSSNISFLYPYPIYIITDLPSSISNMLVVPSKETLPKLFQERGDTRLNNKDQKILAKNRLLQQEISNTNFATDQETIKKFASNQKQILRLEKYNSFLKKIIKNQVEKK